MFTGYATVVVRAQIANYDYFRHVRYGEKMWSGMPAFLAKPIGIIVFLVGSWALLAAIGIVFYPAYPPR